MKVLQNGMKGADVRKWQYFLAGQGFSEVVADGDFGPITEKATRAFQQKIGMSPDGIVGTFTLAHAGTMGFELVKNPPDDNPQGIHWPHKPPFRCLSQSEYQQRFGSFAWQMKPGHNPGREIAITDNWEANNIVTIEAPLFRNLPPFKVSRMRVHKKVARQFEQLFRDWETAGLYKRILTFDGAYYPRMIRGSATNLSSHSYGIAFDINASWNGLGVIPPKAGQQGSVRELVEIANEHGFYWGGHFSRFDGMHFELARVF